MRVELENSGEEDREGRGKLYICINIKYVYPILSSVCTRQDNAFKSFIILDL